MIQLAFYSEHYYTTNTIYNYAKLNFTYYALFEKLIRRNRII